MIPQMEKVGFPRVFATNVTITASVQALLVPPSHNAVIYSLATGGTISIISLFMAGVMPASSSASRSSSSVSSSATAAAIRAARPCRCAKPSRSPSMHYGA